MRAVLLLGLVQAKECHDGACPMSLLQQKQVLQPTDRRIQPEPCGYLLNEVGDASTFMNNNCKYHSNSHDCDRPLQDVLAEHPGMDGYCYFNASAMYVNFYESEAPDYVGSPAKGILKLRGTNYQGLDSGPLVTFHFEGQAITSHIDVDHYAYDDLYGFFLGALQGQGLTLEQLRDPAAWEKASAQKCEEIQATYNFTREDMIFSEVLDMNMPIFAMSFCAAGLELPALLHTPYVTEKAKYKSAADCQPISAREYARHHYMKCLAGVKNSAADLAYLFGRACLKEGNQIRHLEACPFNPVS
ncbi:unnamed protein product [Effrenium voratum]|nr:unnamed protein product [Effrenium voratum]